MSKLFLHDDVGAGLQPVHTKCVSGGFETRPHKMRFACQNYFDMMM